jgi:hypothetical protein
MKSFADVYRQKTRGEDWFIEILRLGQAWYLLNSEFTGEHTDAYWSNGAPLNLKKYGVVRSTRSIEKLKLLSQYANDFWLENPSFQKNANKTADCIHEGFSSLLFSRKLRPYTKKTLEKHLGILIKSKLKSG